ncbi:MAG: hypothetical protein JXA93_06290 [Anaerolineae bacterium]|nr:hypothetical protein [Anaerolineae bacterium]
MNEFDVYLEVGNKKTFAGVIDWPGWCRSGRDEEAALRALHEYAPRYARALAGTGVHFELPAAPQALHVVERLEGGAATDFGAPEVAPSADARPVDDADLARFHALLDACWGAFDTAREAARGKELRKGPRGGGRDVDKMTRHVLDAHAGYLRTLGWKPAKGDEDDADGRITILRQETRQALRAAARGELRERGPRGGIRWTPRYFVRRAAWHILDHAWEIEDRIHPCDAPLSGGI